MGWVAGRNFFYNNSAWDANTADADAADDLAIAPDKFPLISGTARFAHYTSYSRGINGVLIDIANLPAGDISAADFDLKVGNSNSPGTWAAAPVPATITVRRRAGVRVPIALPSSGPTRLPRRRPGCDSSSAPRQPRVWPALRSPTSETQSARAATAQGMRA